MWQMRDRVVYDTEPATMFMVDPNTDAHVALDTSCIGCGYNLKTMAVSGNCPECGRPVNDTLNRPPLERIAGPVRLAAFVMVANAVTIGVSIYVLNVRARFGALGLIGNICIVPILSFLQLCLLGALSGKLYAREGTRVIGLIGVIVFLFFLPLWVTLPTPAPASIAIDFGRGILFVGPVWLIQVILPVTKGVIRLGTRTALRMARWVAGGTVVLGAIQLYILWFHSGYDSFYGWTEIWWDYSGHAGLLLVAVGTNYCVGRIAQRAAREMRRSV